MLNKFSLPEKIEGKIGNAYRRQYVFDEQISKEIDDNREFLRKYLFWVDDSKTLEDVKKATDHFINEWENGTTFCYIITDKNDNAIGSIDAQSIDYKNHSAEIGYWLSQKENGKGYVSDILQKLEELLFCAGVVRIVIKSETENLPSNNVAIKNGYALEGTHKKAINSYGEFKDCNVYAKTK